MRLTMDGWSRSLFLACVAVLVLIAGCGRPAPEAQAAQQPPGPEQQAAVEPPAPVAPVATVGDLEVRNAWARLTPGVGAVYLTVVNAGTESDRLLAVETADAGGVMLHETVEQDAMMRMVGHQHGFEVPAGGSLELAPGGKHVMLMDPVTELTTVALRIVFETAGAVELQIPVRPLE